MKDTSKNIFSKKEDLDKCKSLKKNINRVLPLMCLIVHSINWIEWCAVCSCLVFMVPNTRRDVSGGGWVGKICVVIITSHGSSTISQPFSGLF